MPRVSDSQYCRDSEIPPTEELKGLSAPQTLLTFLDFSDIITLYLSTHILKVNYVASELVKHTHLKKHKVYSLFVLIALALLFVSQQLAYSQQYVIVDSENGDRLSGIWRGSTDTHFEIEYNGQVLQLPLAGYTLKFTSDLAYVPDRTAAKYFHNGLTLLELGLPEKAQQRFEAAIEEFPKYPDAHYQLGLLYKANGDTANALETISFCSNP